MSAAQGWWRMGAMSQLWVLIVLPRNALSYLDAYSHRWERRDTVVSVAYIQLHHCCQCIVHSMSQQ